MHYVDLLFIDIAAENSRAKLQRFFFNLVNTLVRIHLSEKEL